MDIATARQQIESSMERMRVLYATPVFDEWFILFTETPKASVLAYVGPRASEFQFDLSADAQPLIAQAAGQPLAVGDFDFTAAGAGTKYDALLKVGQQIYLVCNNTTMSMAEIRADARWLKAQAAFFSLSEKFRADPLVLA